MPEFDFDTLNANEPIKEEKKTLTPSEIKEKVKDYSKKNLTISEAKQIIIDITGIKKGKLDEVIENKRKELKGLISEEGAIFIIAKEQGIDLPTKSKPESKPEPIDLVLTEPTVKVPEKQKVQPKITTIQKQFIPSFIMVFNGRQGSGKSTAAQLFPTPFILDLEYGKNADSIKYSTIEQIKNLKLGTMNDIKNKKEAIDIVSVQDKEIKKTWDNIKECVEWFKNIGAKNHQTIIFDTTLWLRESRIALEESKKGRQITKFEYKPVSEDEQELLYSLIDFCRTYERNLIFITHWTGKYQSFKNEKGYADSELVGEIPDIKDWYLDAVTWRIDFLKPEESGYNKKYIVYLDKAPRYQYSKLDITNKNLFDIINNLESFEKEINEYKKLEEPTEILDLVGK